MEGAPGTHFTSIMRWDGFQDANYQGKTYGQKDQELSRFIDLPRRTSQKFRIALNGPETLAEYGWEIVPGEIATRTPQAYRQFIQQSRAEFGVAKHGYVKMRGGWFSDRSVCYLASGLPLLIQDTGLSDWLPVGEGVVTFQDLPEHPARHQMRSMPITSVIASPRASWRKSISQRKRSCPPLLQAAMS